MAAGTAFGGIDCFIAWIFVAHEMWGMGGKVVVAVVGAKIIDAEERNGTAGGANVGRGRGYSGGFASCRTFHPGLAAEGGRVEGDAVENVGHGENFGDIPTDEITGEGGGISKREFQRCNFTYLLWYSKSL